MPAGFATIKEEAGVTESALPEKGGTGGGAIPAVRPERGPEVQAQESLEAVPAPATPAGAGAPRADGPGAEQPPAAPAEPADSAPQGATVFDPAPVSLRALNRYRQDPAFRNFIQKTK